MPDPIQYTVGGLTVTAGQSIAVQIPPRVFLGRLTGLLFDTNKTFLLPRSLDGIRGLRRFYAAHPGAQVLVVGHTDTVGSPQANLTLSMERALSITAYLKDDVDAWMEFYAGRQGSAHWGTVEDQHMLSALVDASGAKFHAGPIDGNPATSREGVRRFQGSKGLPADGQAGQRTRTALVTAYMQIDGTTLPAGTVLQMHGCGEFHLAVQTPDETAEQQNRRAEVYFFESRIDPPPRPRCPAPGCPEQPEWLRRTVHVFDLEQGPGALDVAVVDRAGTPLAAAAVHVSGPSVADGQTDATGRARFADLIPGTYTVLGQRQGFRDGTATAQVAEQAGAADGPSSTVVQLQAGTGDLVVTVRDQAGTGLAGAQVLVQDASGASVGNAPTTAGGTVTFPGLAAGTCSVGVSATGFTAQTVTAQVLPNQTNTAQVTLARATGNLTVHVVDSLGGALANASVSVTPASGAAPASQSTDTQGNVTFNGLAAGAAQLGATLQGFNAGAGSATVAANSTVTANLTLTANTAALDVHVTNSAGGADLTGAQVALVGPSGSFSAATAAGGVAHFGALPAGSYTATVTKQDFAQGSGTTLVRINQSNLLNVSLTPSVGTLDVLVQDNLGAATPGASVTLTPPSLAPPASLDTNAQGRIAFVRVPVGNVSILVRKPGFQDGTGTASVLANGSASATVVLQPAAVDLVVRVVDTAGRNLAGAAVSVAGPTSVQGPTGAGGAITFHLPVATYQVSAQLDNFTAPAAQAITLLTNASNVVNITLTPAAVTATVSALPLVVVLRKHACAPARKPVRLGVTGTFTGTGFGRFTRSKPTVKFFTTAAGTTEITFTNRDNEFSAALLTAGVTLFAEGGAVSSGQADTDLHLELFVGTNPIGTPAAGKATCLELTLDLFQSRTAAAGDPAPMAANAKTDTGRFVHVQDTGFHQGRAMLVVRRVQPAGFTGTLTLQRVALPAGSGAVRVFPAAAENHLAGEAETALPHPVTAADLGGAVQVAGSPGLAFFVEGRTACTAVRHLTLQLGIQGDELDGDRATFTVVQFTNLTATVPSTRSPRTGAVAAHPAFTIAGGGPNDFSEDFVANRPLVLMQNSVILGTPVVLGVTVQPPGTPVSWSALRDTRPAPDGDDPVVIALAANAAPTIASTGATSASLLTDAVGSFRVRAFVNNNTTPAFDRDPAAAISFAPDPFILMNLVLVHVRLDNDDVQLHQTLVAAANGGGGIFASSGVFDVLNQPNNTALHHNARSTIIGGGRNGRLGTDRVFGGWMQDAVAAIGHRGTYVDNTVAPPAPHPLITVQENPRRGAFPPTTTPSILPVGPAAAIFPTPPPLLDSGRAGAGRGGLTGCLGQSTITARANVAHGEQLRIQAVDSPAMPYPAAHPGFAAARLTFFHFEMRFRAVLAFWTNNANPPNGGTSGDPAERLYVVALDVPWTMVGEWDVNSTTGAVTVHGTAPAVAMPGNTPHTPAVAAQGLGIEPTVAAGQSTWLGTWIHDAQH